MTGQLEATRDIDFGKLLRLGGRASAETFVNQNKDRRLPGKRRRIARKAANRAARTVAPSNTYRDPAPMLAAAKAMDVTRDRSWLEDQTVTELKDMAKRMGLHGYSKMKKAELVDAIAGR